MATAQEWVSVSGLTDSQGKELRRMEQGVQLPNTVHQTIAVYNSNERTF
jgi:hypothetical protein